METYALPWRFFRRRLLLLVDVCVVLVLGACIGRSHGGVFFGYLGVMSLLVVVVMGSTGLVLASFTKRVVLDGDVMLYEFGGAMRSLDLTKVSGLEVVDHGLFVPHLELRLEGSTLVHRIPVIGYAGRRLLRHIVAHVPPAVRPGKSTETLLEPYKPGLFRPREESLPVPGVR